MYDGYDVQSVSRPIWSSRFYVIAIVMIVRCTSTECMVAHRYDPRTEEVGAALIDAVSADDLQDSIRQGQVEAVRLIPYPQFVADHQEWHRAPCFITRQLLLSRHVDHGSKIVPGPFKETTMMTTILWDHRCRRRRTVPWWIVTSTMDDHFVIHPFRSLANLLLVIKVQW